MATNKCPRCNSPCIIKMVAESSREWREVDVCKMCGSMYPREKKNKPAQTKGATAKKKAKGPSKAGSKSPKKTPAKKKTAKGRKTR